MVPVTSLCRSHTSSGHFNCLHVSISNKDIFRPEEADLEIGNVLNILENCKFYNHIREHYEYTVEDVALIFSVPLALRKFTLMCHRTARRVL